jgi:uncharacterized surface protein with fasciclin (FAS1) repeats
MNRIKKKIYGFRKLPGLGVLLFALLAVFSCSDGIWNSHYDADSEVVEKDNLWTKIEGASELSTFASILKKHGYDKTLSYSQAYTVFAPTNEALASIDTSKMDDVATEFVENHIARYMLPASQSASVVLALNGKRIDFGVLNGGFYFGNAALAVPAKTIVASNGLVHELDGYEPFFPNLFEYLAKGNELDSIRKYVYSFNEKIFVEAASTPGSIDENGQQAYKDSVFRYNNGLLNRIGYINREDSSYTMLVPTNAAWIEAYDRIKNYYVAYNASKKTADSLQRVNTSFALVQDLVFSNNLQKSPQDSLVSTSKNSFHQPYSGILAGSGHVTTSNGQAYVTGLLTIRPTESWHQPIRVEAEVANKGRTVALGTASTGFVSGALANIVSNGKYLRVEPTSSSGNPSVSFEIPNTLSGSYDVCCVFVAPSVEGSVAQANKLYFNLKYLNTGGTYTTSRFPSSGVIQTNPAVVVDTMIVVENFKFPIANYNEKTTTVTFQVVSNVPRAELNLFSRKLLIDCILLKPRD